MRRIRRLLASRFLGWYKHLQMLFVIALLSLNLFVTLPAVAADLVTQRSCIIVDSDGGLDDLRALAVLVPTGRVVAIVVTEGLARTVEGATAIRAFLDRSGRSVPVLAGVAANPDRAYAADPKLAVWRSNAERLNGILAEPGAPSNGSEIFNTPDTLVISLRQHTAGCNTISLLVIGPWSSFMRYAPDILGRIERLVAQGRPYPDELGGEPNGFNCLYDLQACFAAHDLLVGRQLRAGRRLRADWVDIPSSYERCGEAEPGIDKNGIAAYPFSPKEAWFTQMAQAAGMARTVAEIMQTNPSALEKTSLWDDLAALYLLRPDVFARRGGHFEPCVPADTIRAMLIEAMARP